MLGPRSPASSRPRARCPPHTPPPPPHRSGPSSPAPACTPSVDTCGTSRDHKAAGRQVDRSLSSHCIAPLSSESFSPIHPLSPSPLVPQRLTPHSPCHHLPYHPVSPQRTQGTSPCPPPLSVWRPSLADICGRRPTLRGGSLPGGSSTPSRTGVSPHWAPSRQHCPSVLPLGRGRPSSVGTAQAVRPTFSLNPAGTQTQVLCLAQHTFSTGPFPRSNENRA